MDYELEGKNLPDSDSLERVLNKGIIVEYPTLWFSTASDLAVPQDHIVVCFDDETDDSNGVSKKKIAKLIREAAEACAASRELVAHSKQMRNWLYMSLHKEKF